MYYQKEKITVNMPRQSKSCPKLFDMKCIFVSYGNPVNLVTCLCDGTSQKRVNQFDAIQSLAD